MGEVYRARDTKLGRDVAIKILPEAFARHPDRLARLRREAQVLAVLNHPNIATIYELNECADYCLLALELVPGPTLANRLTQGPLFLREALEILRQIAEALEAAHDKGIIHRDLKPANIKVTPEGRVKLLDFGLAKTMTPSSGLAPTNVPTATQMTEAGALLGTLGYMSPEQVRGQPVDNRADIWGFGCVLYETLAGQRLFSGKTASDTLAAILRDTPKLDRLPQDTPAGLRLLLERCVRPDLNRRLQDIGDARIEIEDALAGVTSAPRPRAKLKLLPITWMVTAVVIAAAGWVGGWARRATAPARDVHFQRITDFIGAEESPAISPDGKTVAFVALAGGRRQIWLRLLMGGSPLQITHDDNDHLEPRWAPDSSSLLYFSPSTRPGEQGALWEISALGGAPRRIVSAISGGDISHDGRRIAILHIRNGKTELATVARDGSGPQTLTDLVGFRSYDHPRWSPNDQWIAYHRGISDMFDEGLMLVSASGGDARQIQHGDSYKGMCWLADGSGLVYASSAGSTVRYPPIYNLRTLSVNGAAGKQLTFGDVSYSAPDVHSSGKLVASRLRIQSDIWKFSVTGTPAGNVRAGTRISRQTGQVQTPSLSSDGKEIVYLSDTGGHGNLWVIKVDGSGVRQITFERDPAVKYGLPVWSPVDDEIAVIITRESGTGQWLVRRDGSGLRQLVDRGSGAYWSHDGAWLYYGVQRNGDYRIEKVPVNGGEVVTVRSRSAGNPCGVTADGTLYFLRQLKDSSSIGDYEVCKARPETGPCEALGRVAGSRVPVDPAFLQPVLSPDGRWLAMPLLDEGTANLWALPTDGGAMRPLTDFAARPVLITRRVAWSQDSKWIYAAVAESDADIVLLDGMLQ
jgi:Tol biopolymer transport system component